MKPSDLDMNEAMPAPAPDRPGLYYVTVYLPVKENAGPGELEESSTRLSYRARNEDHAKARALQDHPEATIVNVDYHDSDQVDEEDDGSNHDIDL